MVGLQVASDAVPAERDGPEPVRPQWNWNRVLTPRTALRVLVVAALIVWAYWTYLDPIDLRGYWLATWSHNDAWSHGFLIPVMAALIAHYRLKEGAPPRIEPWVGGLVLILAGGLIRVWSRLIMISYPGEMTFLLVVGGAVLWLLGKQMFRVLWIAVAFLWFMIPWDPQYYEGLALPLQRMSAVFVERVLSLFGVYVVRSGNVLELESGPLNIAEACSGLRLLVAFVALGVFMAYLYRRPLWERLVIMGSSIPIAVLCNFLRVLLMAVASDAIFYERQALEKGHPGWSTWFPRVTGGWGFGYQTPEQLEQFRTNVLDPSSALHQSFGFLMLGLAFVLLYLELGFIDRLFVADEGPAAAGAV